MKSYSICNHLLGVHQAKLLYGLIHLVLKTLIMWIVSIIFSSLLLGGYCENIISSEYAQRNAKLAKCITNIVNKYFTEYLSLTYVNMNNDNDDDILRTIHSMATVALVSRHYSTKCLYPHHGYVIVSNELLDFTENVSYLSMEPTWNPYARFLIIIKLLQHNELSRIFDSLLKLHVTNVLVVNGTKDAHLYTYDPFSNNACGKFFDGAISYGLCEQQHNQLYPNKLVHGLRNCTVTVSVPHIPPYVTHPSKIDNPHLRLGVEQYLFEIVAAHEQLKIKYSYEDYNETYTYITPDMQAIGPLERLQTNGTDVMIGTLFLVSARTEAFTYLHGSLDYVDELLFIVRKATFVEGWKYFYLIFSVPVWCLLLMVFVMFYLIMVILLQPKDKTKLFLSLFGIILNQACLIRGKSKVKCIFIKWVWVSYLLSSYYLTTLVSFTTHPITGYQISTEDDLMRYNLTPCLTPELEAFMMSEYNNSYIIKDKAVNGNESQCVNLVSNSDLYAIVRVSTFLYNLKQYMTEFGDETVHFLPKRYGIYIIATYFYKGFPVSENMRMTSIRLRENGLADKCLSDHHKANFIKLHIHDKEFKIRSALPWYVYLCGCLISAGTLLLEIAVKYKKCANPCSLYNKDS